MIRSATDKALQLSMNNSFDNLRPLSKFSARVVVDLQNSDKLNSDKLNSGELNFNQLNSDELNSDELNSDKLNSIS